MRTPIQRSSTTAVHAASVVLFTFLLSCSGAPEPNPTDAATKAENTVHLTPEQMKNAGIAKGRLEQRSLGVTLPVQGVIEVPPQNLVSVSAPLGGYLRSTD
ncbi:MAG: hypothetical protein JNJ64_11095, partial [Flavobacteriales bacterium]|nr:hypothetical protein [Flavobacteriales bacterium]